MFFFVDSNIISKILIPAQVKTKNNRCIFINKNHSFNIHYIIVYFSKKINMFLVVKHIFLFTTSIALFKTKTLHFYIGEYPNIKV